MKKKLFILISCIILLTGCQTQTPISLVNHYDILHPRLKGKKTPAYLRRPRYIYFLNGLILLSSSSDNPKEWYCFDVDTKSFIPIPRDYMVITNRNLDRFNGIAIPDGSQNDGHLSWSFGNLQKISDEFEWTYNNKKLKAKAPKSTHFTYPYGIFEDYLLISFIRRSSAWRKAGIQAYNKTNGELMWQRLPRRYSGAWSYNNGTLLNVSGSGDQSVIECIDLKTGKQIWGIETNNAHNQYICNSVSNSIDIFPTNLGHYIQSLKHTKGWIIAALSGTVISVSFDGDINWVRKLEFKLNHFNQGAQNPSLGGHYPSSRALNIHKDILYLLDSKGEIHRINIKTGESLSTISTPGGFVAIPIFHKDKIVLITSSQFLIMNSIEQIKEISEQVSPLN